MIKEALLEAVSWLVVLIFVFTVRIFPTKIIEEDYFNLIIGIVLVAVVLAYYLICKNFPRKRRPHILSIAEVLVIGLLIYFAKDLGIYFYSLFLIPVVATALMLEIGPSVWMIALTTLFISFETILKVTAPIAWGDWQVILVILFTIFGRFLALEIKNQRKLSQTAEIKTKELEEIDKLNKEFITLTSHQLFTPLSTIRGFVSLLKNGDLGKLSPKQKEAIGQVYDSVLRMIHLVSELLVVSRINKGKLIFHYQKTNLVSLVEMVVNSFKNRMADKNLYLRVDKPKEKEVLVNIDSEKIENILLNLLDNALKYTEKGGITVKIARQNIARQNIKGKTEAIVSVSDTGAGIPKEYQDRIFQPFFRGKNILELDKKGTGLGLSIAKSFIEEHLGRIWAESEEGKGSTFFFSLPEEKK